MAVYTFWLVYLGIGDFLIKQQYFSVIYCAMPLISHYFLKVFRRSKKKYIRKLYHKYYYIEDSISGNAMSEVNFRKADLQGDGEPDHELLLPGTAPFRQFHHRHSLHWVRSAQIFPVSEMAIDGISFLYNFDHELEVILQFQINLQIHRRISLKFRNQRFYFDEELFLETFKLSHHCPRWLSDLQLKGTF